VWCGGARLGFPVDPFRYHRAVPVLPAVSADDEPIRDVEGTTVSRRSRTTIRDSEFPASSVIGAVADREGVDQIALPPLYDAVGPDVLETRHRADGEFRQTVTFEYVGYVVTVDSDGSVVIDE